MNFLSIDLDYWFCNGLSHEHSKTCILFLKQVLEQNNNNIFVTNSHEEFLKFIPNKIETLTHIDFHSDYINPVELDNEIEEGNWINYLKVDNFFWHYPSYVKCIFDRMGLCGDYQIDLFGFSHFKKFSAIHGLKNIKKTGYDSIGISISPQWIGIYNTNGYNEDINTVLAYINSVKTVENKNYLDFFCNRI